MMESAMAAKVLVAVIFLATAMPAIAHDEIAPAPIRLTLKIPHDAPGERCIRIESSDPRALRRVALYRTFHDDFDVHPLLSGRWVPHYTGPVEMPDSFYAGGDASAPERKSRYNGEQEVYVDPTYKGLGTIPLGLDPFHVEGGILSITAMRTPPELKPLLFNSEYISGILTTQKSFSQKYGYFEIRSKIPVGTGVWPAFWLLANDGGWPPEIDVMEGRGQRPGDLVMTTHWRIPSGKIESCGFDFLLADASSEFHNYGILWQPDRLIYFIDRKPVTDIKVPIGFDDPMYMIVNLAMGAKYFTGVGVVDGESPLMVEFQIDRISAYQIDALE